MYLLIWTDSALALMERLTTNSCEVTKRRGNEWTVANCHFNVIKYEVEMLSDDFNNIEPLECIITKA